jgi:hypothetical protein
VHLLCIVFNEFCVTKIKYIMQNVQDYSVLYNNAVRPVICEARIPKFCIFGRYTDFFLSNLDFCVYFLNLLY